MKAAGIRTCETDQSSVTIKGKAQLFPLGPNVSMEATSNKTSTIGCEEISVITEKY